MSDSGIDDDELAEIIVKDEHLRLEVQEKAIAQKAHQKQAIAKGMDPLDWNITRRLAKSGDAAAFAAHIREIVRIGGIMLPELDPKDLIAGVPQVSAETRLSIDLMRAQQEGFAIGLEAKGAENNPYTPDSPLHAEWHNYWDRGLRAVENSLGPRTRLVTAKREKPQKKEPIPGLSVPRFRVHTRGEEEAVVN